MSTAPERDPAGNGLRTLGVVVAVVGLFATAAGYDEISSADTVVKVTYFFTTAVPAIVGGGLLYGLGLIIQEIRNRR